MKKLFIVGLLLALFPVANNRVYADQITENKSVKIASMADTQVSAGENADKNYGRYANMNVRSRATKDKNYYESYIKFSLPKVVSSVTEANINLTYHTVGSDSLGKSFTVYTTDTTWNEGSGNANGEESTVTENRLTYNNASELAATHTENFTTFEITGTLPVRGDVISVDVKSIVNKYLENRIADDNPIEVSFRIVSNATVNQKDLLFRTKENTNGGAPTLSFSYNHTYTPIEPEQIYSGLSYKEEEIYNSAGFDVDMFTLEMDASSNLSIMTGVPYNRTPLQVGLRQTPSGQAKAAQDAGYNVLAAINADFFRINEDDAIQPRGLTVRDGIELTPINDWKFFGILKNGDAIIGDANTYAENKDQIMHAVGGDSGYLVKDGVAITSNADGGCHSEDIVAPRTAIGIKADGSVVMTVADGRSSISNGLVLVDLANYLVEQGCVTAINLDGGGSSAMSIKDKDTNVFSAVNNPSDGSEREVGNTLLIYDPTTSVDKTKINKTLSIAENVLSTYSFGDKPGQYPLEQKNNLEQLVQRAKELLQQSNLTQNQLDEIENEIKEALLELESSLIPIDRSRLNSLVNELKNLLLNATFGIEKNNYPIEQELIVENAIAEALVVLTRTNATQDEIDAAASNLQIIIDNFKASQILVNTQELRSVIEQLDAKIDEIIEEDSYTSEQKQRLKLLLMGAEALLNDSSSTQEDIDMAVEAILDEINNLNNIDDDTSNNNTDNNTNDNDNNNNDIVDNNEENDNSNNQNPLLIPAIIVSITIVIVGAIVIIFINKNRK